jgi:outer membrane protein TolC
VFALVVAVALVPMRVVTLDDAMALARDADLRLETTRIDEDAALLRTGDAFARVLPTIEAGAGITRNAKEIVIGDRIVTPLYVPNANVVGRMPLFRGPDLPNAIATFYEGRAVNAESGELRESYANDVATLFLALAEADMVYTLAREAHARAAERRRIAEARVAIGEAIALESNDARAEEARALAVLAGIERDRADVLAFFRLRTGIDDDEALTFECERCVLPPEEQDDARFMQLRGDLVALRRRGTASIADELAHAGAFLPTVDAVANARLQQPTLFNPEPLWWTAQISLTWTIFGGTSPSGGTRMLSLLERDRRRARIDVTKRLLTDEIRAAGVRAAATHRAALALSEATAIESDAARAALTVVEARYAEGEASSLDLSFAARRAADADQASARARFQAERAALAWRRTLGLGPTDDGENHGG